MSEQSAAAHTTRAICYARVSTDEQAERGFSLRQQAQRLREYAAEQGWEVVEEIADPGFSGAKLDRPGLDRARDLVAAGGVDVALAQDMDRWSRDPAHMLLLEREFERAGCELQALDSWGDGSPSSDMLRTIRSAVSKYERDVIAERVRRNKLGKAREGKVVGGHNRAYGFSWATDESGRVVGYEVDALEMRVVRRIFEEVAAGTGVRTLKEKLDRERVPTPGKGESWSRPFIKELLFDDLYKPHSVEELRVAGVAEAVLGTLSEPFYGVYRYQDIPVPIPDAGLSVEVIEAARDALRGNRSPSRAAQRFWELSGGILRCGECGRAMQPLTSNRRPGSKTYFYYRCQAIQNGRRDKCSNRKVIPAQKLEEQVWSFVAAYVDDPDAMLQIAHEIARRDIDKAEKAETDAKALADRLAELEKQKANHQRAFAADALSLEDLRERTAEIEDERASLERELQTISGRETDVQALRAEHLRTIEALRADAARDSEIEEAVAYEHGELQKAPVSPERRRERYEQLRVSVGVGEDGVPRVSGAFELVSGGESACQSEGWLWRRCTPTTPPAL